MVLCMVGELAVESCRTVGGVALYNDSRSRRDAVRNSRRRRAAIRSPLICLVFCLLYMALVAIYTDKATACNP